MNSDLINKIILVGNGSDLYMAALLLSKNLSPYGVEVTCLELSEEEVSSPVGCIGAEFSSLFEIIEANLFEAMTVSHGTFSYGTRYYASGQDWFCPYGQYGLVNAENEFEQGLFRYLGPELANRLDDYSLAAVAAKNAKFAIASASKPELQSALEFGAFLDAGLYKQYLKGLFAKSGNEIVECESISKIIRKNDYKIKEVITNQNVIVGGDFWFDCSGDKACLAAGLDRYQKLVAYQNFKHDRILYFVANDHNDLNEPFSTASYTEVGFTKKIPLKSKTWYEVHVDSSRSDESKIKSAIGNEIGAHVDYRFTEDLIVGVFPTPWVGNCLFVGHSGNNLGRSVIPESSLVQEAVIRFLDVYPSRTCLDAAARGYNNSWASVIQEASDYAALYILLPWLNVREGAYKNQVAPASLRKRIDLFKRFGRLPVAETDIVRDQQWYAMLFGLGIRPELHSVMIASITDQEMEETMDQLKLIIRKIEKTMPASREFFNKVCP